MFSRGLPEFSGQAGTSCFAQYDKCVISVIDNEFEHTFNPGNRKIVIKESTLKIRILKYADN